MTQDLKRLEFHGNATIDFDNIAFIVLASILASVALLSHSIPVLIGAMILAPTFDPLVAIPFGLINRDWKLLRQGITGSAILLTVSGAVCLLTVKLLLLTNAVPGSLTTVGPDMVTERLVTGWHSFIVALTAGAGGALASASNRRENLIGVILALALVPALAASAVAFNYQQVNGWGGLKLFGINIVGILISGLIVLALRRGSGDVQEKVKKKEL